MSSEIGSPNIPEKQREQYENLARNIVWQYGDVFLSTDQQIELYGDGVELEFVEDRDSRPDSLPIADVAFGRRNTKITFCMEDYNYLLDVVCRPQQLNGHKAAAFYIGAGVAVGVLHEFMARNNSYKMVDSLYEELSKPLPLDSFLQRLTLQLGQDEQAQEIIRKLYENIMVSDEKRLLRINALRYGIGVLFSVMETSDTKWALWASDDGDRIGYQIDFRDAFAKEMADAIRTQHRRDRLTRALGKTSEWQATNFYDRVPEILIAGSVPMSREEVDRINDILMD